MISERPYLRLTAPFWFVVLGLGASGCTGNSSSDNLARLPIAGSVLMDGRPLAKGAILFYPIHHPVFGTAVSAGDVIHNGRFSIRADKGLIPGKYRIAISSAGVHHPHIGVPKPELTADEVIPDRFNVETELEFEVKAGGIKHLKIEIDSK